MTMSLQLQLIDLFTIGAALIASFWTLIVIIVRQFKADLTTRFAALETARNEANEQTNLRFDRMEHAHREASEQANQRFDRIEATQKNLDRDLLMLKAELPDKYVRREDAIRSEMTLHAKFDGLAARIDTFLRVKKDE